MNVSDLSKGKFIIGNYLTALLDINKFDRLGKFDYFNPTIFYIFESSILSEVMDGKFNLGRVGTVSFILLRVRLYNLSKTHLSKADISFKPR